MRVRLKGINTVKKRLADGELKTYRYAWKGGPPLVGLPGSPEFHASYAEAVSSRTRSADGLLRSLLDQYERSPAFTGLAAATKKSYLVHLRKIDRDFGDMPIRALEDRRVRGDFLAWRDRLAATSRRQADLAFTVLARVISWSYDRGLAPANPCQRPGRLYRSSRSDAIWTEADEAAFLDKAPEHLHLPLLLALWTGQRQGDLLKLPWSAYDGKHIRLRQQKTGTRVFIPVGEPLRVALDAARHRSLEVNGDSASSTILKTLQGTAWTSDGFRASWRTARQKAGVTGLTFHDLRGTAVTRLAIAGCNEAEIATITGHSLRDVGAILDSYLKRDAALAWSAIRKLEESRKTPN